MAILFFRSNRPVILYGLAILAVVALLFGGASRLDVAAPIVVRLTAIGLLLMLAWRMPVPAASPGRLAIAVWAVLLLTPLLQIIPLPWSIWTQLPGREMARDAYGLLGTRPWQPLSLTPDRTLNGLFALLPALAAYLLGLRLDTDGRSSLLTLLALLCVASAVLGILQFAAGPGSSLYFYAITNSDSSVGFFSNANHHALFLCIGIVLICHWLSGQFPPDKAVPMAQIIAAAAGLLLLFVSLVGTSSRAGIGLSLLALAGGVSLLPLRRLKLTPLRIAALVGIPMVLLAIVTAMILTGNLFGDRFAIEATNNGRIQNVPLFARIASDFFPFGAGAGSFDPVFRTYETVAALDFAYLNNAHNDYAQIAIEAGLAGLAGLALLLVWWLRAAWSAFVPASGERSGRVARQQRAAAMITALVLLHSLVDYPLRTAALATLFALCCAFLRAPAHAGRQARAVKNHSIEEYPA